LYNDYFDTENDGSEEDAGFVYTYDDTGRLVTSVYTDNTESSTTTTTYTYDAVGNRLSKSDGTTTTSYTIGPYNQIAS
jgi:YD repeat-containing protein